MQMPPHQDSHHSFNFHVQLARSLSDPNASSSTLTLDSISDPCVDSMEVIAGGRFSTMKDKRSKSRNPGQAVGVENHEVNSITQQSGLGLKDKTESRSRSSRTRRYRRNADDSGRVQAHLSLGSSCPIQNENNKQDRSSKIDAKPFKKGFVDVSNSLSWMAFFILLVRLPTACAIFDPGEGSKENHQSSSSSSSPSPSTTFSVSTASSTPNLMKSTERLALHDFHTPASGNQPKVEESSQLYSSDSNQILLSEHLEPNDFDLIPFSPSGSNSLYSSRQDSLPPGCKRIKDLFVNSQNGFCLNPFNEIMLSQNQHQHQHQPQDGDRNPNMIESELVICEVDEIEPLLKPEDGSAAAGGDDSDSQTTRKKKKTKMRSYAISGTISSPFPLEIEPDLKSLQDFLDFKRLHGGSFERIESSTSSTEQIDQVSSPATSSSNTASDTHLSDQQKKSQDEEDEENWPKEGMDTENGYWRQVDGRMKWQPSVSEPEPLIDSDAVTQSEKFRAEKNQASSTGENSQNSTISQGDASSKTEQVPTKTQSNNSEPTKLPSVEESNSISSSQSRAYSSWTSLQSSVASAAAASKASESHESHTISAEAPSFLSFNEWKEIHLKQEREELGRIKESKRERRDGTGHDSNVKDSKKPVESNPNRSSINIPSVSSAASTDQSAASSGNSGAKPQNQTPETQIPTRLGQVPSESPPGSSSILKDRHSDSTPKVEEIPLVNPSEIQPSKTPYSATDSNLLGGALPALGDPIKQLSNLKHRWNFASFDCAAVVHRSNPSAKFASAILSEKKDRYMLSPCPGVNKKSKSSSSSGSDPGEVEEEEGQFVIVELCDEISIDTIVLGNYEFFSRMFKRFRVRVARNLQGREDEWYDVGTFRARNVRGLQVFNTIPPRADSRFFRYVRIDFLEHYGSEYYCPVSLLRVYGLTQMDDYIREEEELKKQEMLEMEGLGEWEGELEPESINYELPAQPSEAGNGKRDSETEFDELARERDEMKEAVEDKAEDNSANSVSNHQSQSVREKQPPASQVNSQPEVPTQPAETSSNSTQISDPNRIQSQKETPPPASSLVHQNPLDDSTDLAVESSVGENLISSKDDKDTSRHLAPSTPPPSLKPTISTPTPTPTSISNSTSAQEMPRDETIPIEMRPPSQEIFEVGAANSTLGKGPESNMNSSSVASSHSSSTLSTSSFSSNQSSSSSGSTSTSTASSPSSSSISIVEQSRSSNIPPPVGSNPSAGSGNVGGGGGGSESIYRTISKRLNALESNATLSLQYMEHSGQALREVFARMERRQEEKMGEMLRALNGSNWRQIEALKRRQHVDLQRALFEFDVHRQKVDAERVSLLAQVHVLADEVMLERRLSIAQLILLLALFVFMALTRGSRAAPFMASFSRGRSISRGNPRLSGQRIISSPPTGLTSSSPSPFEGHPQSEEFRLRDEIAEKNLKKRTRNHPESSSSRSQASFKGRGHSRARSGQGLASENRPVRLPRSLKPPSFSRTRAQSRSLNQPKPLGIAPTEENGSSPTRASAPASSFTDWISKPDRDVLKQSLRINVLNDHNDSKSFTSSDSLSKEDFSQMSPNSLRAHLGLSPRASSPSSPIYPAHHPSEIRKYLQTPPTPRSSSPISLSQIKARYGGYSNGHRSSLLTLNGSSQASPAHHIDGAPANAAGEMTRSSRPEDRGAEEEVEAEEAQNQQSVRDFRSDDSVSSWTDRSDNSEDGNSDDDLSSFSHHHFRDADETGDLDGPTSDPSIGLAPSLTFTSPRDEQETFHSKRDDRAAAREPFPLSSEEDPMTPSSSNPTFSDVSNENASEWQEVLPRRSATFRRQGPTGLTGVKEKRSDPPHRGLRTTPPLERIPVRSSSSLTLASPRSQSPSISSPSTPNT